jgi:CheY-like chemotaxis protein
MFSRKQLAQQQLLDLNDAIKESASMLRVLIGESIRLKIECAPSLPAIYADAGMIQQVLINLAANARDAMSKGGDLRVASSVVELSETDAGRVPEARPGRFVCLSVSDTGCGIDARTLERIFEPFFTTKEPGKGTGLGLATVYGIAKQHHGWVEVNSEPGKGATFRVLFPAASKSVSYESDLFRDHVAGGSETILVVEDEAPLRELVVEILQQYGYQTIEATSGAHALEVWKTNREIIDLVLTDVMMPEGVSGRDLAERVLIENPQMKVIYTSGYPMDVLGRDFFQKEGVTFLQKPYHPQTLARVVRQCLDS